MKNAICFAIIFMTASASPAGADQAPDSTTADSTQRLTDGLRGASADSEGVLSNSSALEIIFSEDRLADLDHEEFGDWLAVLPGFYPLDQAALGAPYRGLVLGIDPAAAELQFRGRRLEDHLLGGADFGWIPPEALRRLRYQSLALTSAGGKIEALLRSLEVAPPSSRVAVRDGYYGLGTVDFELVQKLAPSVILNGGGRIATYGGRVPNSEGYGLNLRSEITFQLNSEISGWGGLMQGKQNSQLPGTEGSYNRDRYEADLAMQYRSFQANLFGIQQRETYLGEGSDGWDEIGWLGSWQDDTGALRAQTQVRLSAARWRLEGLSWASTTFGGAQAEWLWQPARGISTTANLGWDVSDDFAPARHLGVGVRVPLINPLAGFVGLSQHQVQPTRFESAADFQPGEHFLPYDPALLQNPDSPVLGERTLKNETYSIAMTGMEMASRITHSAIGLFWRRIEEPITWQFENGVLHSRNGDAEEAAGALGWMLFRPLDKLDLGATGSFLPHNSADESIFPEAIAHAWAQFRQKLFKEELELRFRLGADYWGSRQAPVPGGWDDWGEVLVVNGRISANLLGAHLFWGINNIFSQDYMLYPGHAMMHKEEIWGVAWNFRN